MSPQDKSRDIQDRWFGEYGPESIVADDDVIFLLARVNQLEKVIIDTIADYYQAEKNGLSFNGYRELLKQALNTNPI